MLQKLFKLMVVAGVFITCAGFGTCFLGMASTMGTEPGSTEHTSGALLGALGMLAFFGGPFLMFIGGAARYLSKD